MARAQRQARAARGRRRPLRKARTFSRRVARNRPVPKVPKCTPIPPAFRDGITGWFGYTCGDATLLVPAPRCVGPECRGGGRIGTPTLGYQGELDAGSRGSFLQAGRLIGVTAMDGVEIARGLAEINGLRERGEIDGYYAGAARRAYLERIGDKPVREAPFERPSALGLPLAPSALRRRYVGVKGEAVGPSVAEACRCTPRPFDAIDPVSGWGIYYVPTGVLLTPSQKCVGGGGRPASFWRRTFQNVAALVTPSAPVPELPVSTPAPPTFLAPPPPPSAGPPAPPKLYLCLDPRIFPPAWRPQPSPCTAPQISYPGQ